MAKEKTSKLEEEGEKPKEAEKPKKKGKLLIIIIAAVVLLAGAGGAYFFFIGKSSEQSKNSAAKDQKNAQGVNFALDPFVVNLMDQSGSKYLKVSVQIELANAKLMEHAKNKTPQIRDAIITLLTNKTSEELITAEGKLLLKDEIKLRANQILGEGTVINVYITDFVMQ
ncbi:MAG: flagellar basal body-associated protein FliL [Thermodesulfovibrio sp.]|nr:flagellar basal body-associated FliL family protein [Thermodesulfovibrio sp.]MDW7999234.1 flagellar basal body-associated protein FliL [Thermodesulfovibrio sp.]